ncbi:P protein-like [Cydia splendana]|uniref:P protein-like n=1 Tax=Cydia splendana TaxID=1100963 RepID=UPI00300D11BA
MDWWQSVKQWVGLPKKQPKVEGNRSQYSMVPRGELTADILTIWIELPDEVKNDPSLARYKKLYEEKHGKIPVISKNPESQKRLKHVQSAPMLQSVQSDEMQYKNDRNKTEAAEKLGNHDETPISGQRLPNSRSSQMARARKYVKMTIVLGCWVYFTTCFMMYNEKKENVSITAVVSGEMKEFSMPIDKAESILLKLTAQFMSENDERRFNSTALPDHQKLEVWLEAENNNVTEASETWSIPLHNSTNQRSRTLHFNCSHCALRLRTDARAAVAFTYSYTENPVDDATGVICALVLLIGLYILIGLEVINRTMAAVLASTMSLAVLAMVGERPTVPEIVSWLDIETLILLFSMMLLVTIMAETGVFDFVSVYTFEVTKGNLWSLIYLLCGITAVLSTFLDNVTTVLLMSPVTIRLCEVMDLDPVPILMLMAIYSNIGGTATPVGDPPCVVVASNKHVIEAGINFTNFTAHMALGILLVAVQTSLQVRYMFRDTNNLRLNIPKEIQDLRHQISIWRRAADSLPQLSGNAHVVRAHLERNIEKLRAQLSRMVKETSTRACPRDEFQSTLRELKKKYKIRDKALLVKASVAIFFAVAVFFLHSIPQLNRISLGWTALLAAVLLLLLADREDLEPVLRRVEWSTLLFFAALFVLMEALSKLGLIQYIGGLMEDLVLKVDESWRLAVAILLILWVGGVISAFVDNLPMTTIMIRVVISISSNPDLNLPFAPLVWALLIVPAFWPQLTWGAFIRVVISIGSNPDLNLPLAPLVWALLYGACLGGNGTLIGASANVVCAGVAEQHGYKITFVQFLKVGFPIMIGHMAAASVYLLLCHCVFTWH